MSSQSKQRLLAAAVVALVVVGGIVGWQYLAPKPVPHTTVAVNPSITTATVTQATAASTRPTEWIKIGEVKSVSYYLSLLESNGTAPYVQLAKELGKLPDLANATAVAKITYLALNATNLEVEEAFELMMKGGTPSLRDFPYAIPQYNTELQVLYTLACRNEFKTNDTTALAISVTHGLWVAMGDNDIKDLLWKDVSDFLGFLRRTDQLQSERKYSNLEKYPLEVKICLSWRGDQSSVRSYHDPRDYLYRQMDSKAYRWATIELTTLIQMQDLMDAKSWIKSDFVQAVRILEATFFTGGDRLWIYPNTDDLIVIDGESVLCHNFNSADSEFKYYLATGKGIGWCSDEMGFLSALCKSWGIATTSLWGDRIVDGKKVGGHTHIVYFDPSDGRWKADSTQLDIDVKNQFNHFFLFKPKTTLEGLTEANQGVERRYVFSKFVMTQSDVNEVKSLFLQGIPTAQMKQWLLYS